MQRVCVFVWGDRERKRKRKMDRLRETEKERKKETEKVFIISKNLICKLKFLGGGKPTMSTMAGQ